MDNIEHDVRQIIAEIIEKNPDEIDPEARFVEDLGVDSMMALEMLAALEKKFKIAMPEENLAKILTLNQTIALVKELLPH